MKKTVYFFDKMIFNENKSLYTSLLKPLNELSDFYTGLGLKQPFSKEIMLKAINNLSEFQNSIVQDLATTLQMVNVPKVIHDSLQKQIEISINQIGEIVERVRKSYGIARQFTTTTLILDYDLFTVEESGKVVFDESGEARLTDLCSIYLTNEVQKKAVDMVADINTKANELRNLLSNLMTGLPKENKTLIQNITDSFNGTDICLNPWIVERLR